MVQEEALLIQMSQSRRIFVSGIGKMQPPQWERGDAFSSPVVQRRRETTLPPAESTGMPCGARPQLPCGKSPVAPLASPILGSEQGWLDPGMAWALRSSLCPAATAVVTPAPRAACWMPHAGAGCQIVFARKGAMLAVAGAAVPQRWAGAEPRQLLCASQPCCPCSLPAHGEGRAWISAFRSLS